MATNKSNLTEVKKEAVSRKVKMTRGKLVDSDHIVYNYMNNKSKFPDIEWIKMQEVSCPAKVNGMAANLVLFFNLDSAKEKNVIIGDYLSLKEHPELILYEGYYVRGKGGEVLIKKWEGVEASILEEKIKKGVISEVGVEIEKSAGQKFLSGFGHFLMMGGFLLVLLLIVGIAVAISILAKGC